MSPIDIFSTIDQGHEVDMLSPIEIAKDQEMYSAEDKKDAEFFRKLIELNNNSDTNMFGEREKKVGDIVWAKVDIESPFMPAIVFETQLPINVPDKHICVVFFGPRDIGVVHRKNALSYKQHRRQMVQGHFTPQLIAADDKATAYQINKELHASYAQPDEAGNVIKIRRGINPMYNEHDQNQMQKQYLTDELDLANPVVQLSHLRNRLAELQKRNRVLEEEKVQKEIDCLAHTTAIDKWKLKYDRLKGSVHTAKRTMAPPSRIRKVDESPPTKRPRLSIKKEVAPPPGAVKLDEEGNEIYEVQSIVRHKYEKGRLEFRIHWKGYTRHDQEWVPIHKLQCRDLLSKYLHRKGVPDAQTLIDRAEARLNAPQPKKKRKRCFN